MDEEQINLLKQIADNTKGTAKALVFIIIIELAFLLLGLQGTFTSLAICDLFVRSYHHPKPSITILAWSPKARISDARSGFN
jgi:hypothetical protein